MEIKPYTANHHKSCVEIFDSNTPLYFAPDEREGLEVWLTGQDEGRKAYKNTVVEYFYVAEDDGTVIGCGGFYIVPGAPIANMVWGMVHSSLHGKGVGKRLFEYRIAAVKSEYPGYRITLDTTQHTYRFFEKLGFSVTQVRSDFYGIGLDRYDMVLL